MTRSETSRPNHESAPDQGGEFVPVASLDALTRKGRMVVKLGAKQIALFHGEKGVFACNNRCPHEGFPLIEGKLTNGCVLTCNWHNWKFDLEKGTTLVGGDRLRRYPLRVEGDQVLIDPRDPPAEERAGAALDNLRASFRRHEYDRMARELARLQQAGGDPLEAVRQAIHWTYDRFEFGTSHAHGSAADWLALGEARARDAAERLVPPLEIVGYLAWDTLREPAYPYPDGVAPYDPAALVAAIEREDEVAAIALVRGALAEGHGFTELERPLAEAALAHYQDFGHSAIYLVKTGALIERLGPSVTEPLVLALTRSLIYASREDLIPEFRSYASHLGEWESAANQPVAAEDFIGLSASRAMARAARSSADSDALYHALLGVGAWNLLHYDTSYQEQSDRPVSQNVGWLSFTHHITFANAVRILCNHNPTLWPQALLQMACFAGRNAGFIDRDLDESRWRVGSSAEILEPALEGLFDHGQAEYIVSAHLVKTLMAAQSEIAAAPEAPWVPVLLAGLKRFLETPLKRKHTTRTARQSLKFVEAEG